MKKFKVKPGDILKVPIDNELYYIQYLVNDSTLFNSNIIRVFNYSTNKNMTVDLRRIVEKEVLFIAHTMIKGGVKLCNWEILGNVPLSETFETPVFRATDDVYSEVKKSNKWFIWKPNEKEMKVGKLPKHYKDLPYGTVYHPMDIVEWIKNGTHGFMYPK